jgi:hypothetical protein
MLIIKAHGFSQKKKIKKKEREPFQDIGHPSQEF